MKNKIYEDVHRGQERNARKTENFNKETEKYKKKEASNNNHGVENTRTYLIKKSMGSSTADQIK